MDLTVLERLVVMNLLPKEGSMLELKAAQNVREAIEFDEQELAALKFQQENGPDGKAQVKWDAEVAEKTKLSRDFTGPQTKVIVTALQKLDAEKKLTTEHLTLCEKFGIGKDK